MTDPVKITETLLRTMDMQHVAKFASRGNLFDVWSQGHPGIQFILQRPEEPDNEGQAPFDVRLAMGFAPLSVIDDEGAVLDDEEVELLFYEMMDGDERLTEILTGQTVEELEAHQEECAEPV